MSLADKLIEIERNVPRVYEAGYAAGLVDGQDTNLFDIDSPVFYATSSYNARFLPKIEDGIFYNGGQAGDHDGAATCVPVEPGDIVTFSATYPTDITFTIGVFAGHEPVDGVFTSYVRLSSSMGTGSSGEKFFAVQIPAGYEWFGFTVAGTAHYAVQVTNIQITRQNNPTGEMAVAYNILSGVVE